MPNRITKLFLDGVKEYTVSCTDSRAGRWHYNNTAERQHYRHPSLQTFPKPSPVPEGWTSVSMMYVTQTVINLFMPSGSAKAALTMPMMSQFSDLIGVSRQATVVAFQLGDGFTNMITPTSGVLLGVLSVAKIPYEKWFRWVLPFIAILFLLGFLLLIPTVFMDLKGF